MHRRPCLGSLHRRLPQSRMAARRPATTWARASETTWQTASTGAGCRHVSTGVFAWAMCTEDCMGRPENVCLHVPITCLLWVGCGACCGECHGTHRRDAAAAGQKLVCACTRTLLSSLEDRLNTRGGRGCLTEAAFQLMCTCASLLLTSSAGRQGIRSGNCWGGVLRVDLELASGDLLQPARYATRDRLLAQVPWLRLLPCCQDMGGIARTTSPEPLGALLG